MQLLTPLDPPRPDSQAPLWMVTFADLLSLLLAFFVLVYATTSADQQRWKARIAPIAHFLAGVEQAPETPLPAPKAPSAVVKDPGYIRALFDGLASESSSFAGASVLRGRHEVTLRVPGALDSALSHAELAHILAAMDNTAEIRVIGKRPSDAGTDSGLSWQRALSAAATIRADLAVRSGRHDIVATGAVEGIGGQAGATGYVELRLSDTPGTGHAAR